MRPSLFPTCCTFCRLCRGRYHRNGLNLRGWRLPQPSFFEPELNCPPSQRLRSRAGDDMLRVRGSYAAQIAAQESARIEVLMTSGSRYKAVKGPSSCTVKPWPRCLAPARLWTQYRFQHFGGIRFIRCFRVWQLHLLATPVKSSIFYGRPPMSAPSAPRTRPSWSDWSQLHGAYA